MRVKTVKGTRDLLPPETSVWAAVEETARRVFSSYGYGEIRTPILEETTLFERGVGESSDIVGKEMYTFEDRKGRRLCLRPENTAPVARAYLQHRMADGPAPVKLFYTGPQFRYERPQAGRYRQFYQIGAELIGDPGPWTDVELLAMLVRFLQELGFEELEVLLNTVGDPASRAAYGDALRAYFEPLADRLGEDSRRRLESNPLRILDTKIAAERELLAAAPRLGDFLSEESREHFAAVRSGLEGLGVPYRLEERLVRGLDYYTRTVFEIVSSSLGAQDAILGGGRYDGLIAEIGGPSVPGIGFAIGSDRLVESLPESSPARRRTVAPVVVVPVGETGPSSALDLAEELRDAGLKTLAELGGRSVKAALKQAARSEARWVLLLGEEEMAAGEVTIKDFETGHQERRPRAGLAAWLEQRIEERTV